MAPRGNSRAEPEPKQAWEIEMERYPRITGADIPSLHYPATVPAPPEGKKRAKPRQRNRFYYSAGGIEMDRLADVPVREKEDWEDDSKAFEEAKKRLAEEEKEEEREKAKKAPRDEPEAVVPAKLGLMLPPPRPNPKVAAPAASAAGPAPAAAPPPAAAPTTIAAAAPTRRSGRLAAAAAPAALPTPPTATTTSSTSTSTKRKLLEATDAEDLAADGASAPKKPKHDVPALRATKSVKARAPISSTPALSKKAATPAPPPPPTIAKLEAAERATFASNWATSAAILVPGLGPFEKQAPLSSLVILWSAARAGKQLETCRKQVDFLVLSEKQTRRRIERLRERKERKFGGEGGGMGGMGVGEEKRLEMEGDLVFLEKSLVGIMALREGWLGLCAKMSV